MQLAADLATGLVALFHLIFLVLEMFFWDRPLGLKVFRHSLATARASRVLAANQGLYNGFLAAGLIWSLLLQAHDVRVFFLVCVIIAGVFGAITAVRQILFVQALPAAAALGLVWAA